MNTPCRFQRLPFSEFLKLAQNPEVIRIQDSDLSGEDVKRAADFLAGVFNAVDTATSKYVKFSSEGERVLRQGGRLMHHKDGLLAGIVDSSGKIVEVGSVVGPSLAQLSLSVYSALSALAWVVVARDIKKSLNVVGEKLDELLILHRTAELAEVETAYERLRGCGSRQADEDKVVINHAIIKASEARSRSRQRLTLQTEKWIANNSQSNDIVRTAIDVASLSLFPISVIGESYIRRKVLDARRLANERLHDLAMYSLAVLMHAEAVRLMGDAYSTSDFGRLMGEEAQELQSIGQTIEERWNSWVPRRVSGLPPIVEGVKAYSSILSLIGQVS